MRSTWRSPRCLGADFPWATTFINVSGSIVMGAAGRLAGVPRRRRHGRRPTRLFVATGILGGYTTFSTFSLETILLIERGEIGAALAYVGGSVLLGVVGLWAGSALVRR